MLCLQNCAKKWKIAQSNKSTQGGLARGPVITVHWAIQEATRPSFLMVKDSSPYIKTIAAVRRPIRNLTSSRAVTSEPAAFTRAHDRIANSLLLK